MNILVTTEIHGTTQFEYDTLLARIEGDLKAATGLIAHSSHRISGGWRIVEIWETIEASNRFFVTCVAPNLPPGRLPFRSFQELHSCIQPKKAAPKSPKTALADKKTSG